MAPEITVLTAVRNGAEDLPRAIASIRSQTFTDWEYVIVDDDSEDETAEVVERAAAVDGRIVLVRRATSEGPYVAANDGLAVARGKYVARLDADDVALPDRLETQVAFLRASPQYRACGAFFRYLTEDGGVSAIVSGKVPRRPGELRWWLCAAGGPAHSTAFFEKAAVEEIGGYGARPLAQDRRLWCTLSRRGWLAVLPEVVVHRRRHERQLTSRASALQLVLSLDAAREHIREMTGESWTWTETEDLWRVAHRRPINTTAALRAMRRWQRLWSGDRSLQPEERRALARWMFRWGRPFVPKPLGAMIPLVARAARAVRPA